MIAEAAQREWEKVNENSKVQKASLVRAASNAELPFIQLSKSRPRNFSFRNLRTYAVKRRSAFKHWWSSPEVYSFRVRLDERIQAFKHSRHLKHAFKCAFGISLLTLPGHLPASNAGEFVIKYLHNTQKIYADLKDRVSVVRRCSRSVDSDLLSVLSANEHSSHISRCRLSYSEARQYHCRRSHLARANTG